MIHTEAGALAVIPRRLLATGVAAFRRNELKDHLDLTEPVSQGLHNRPKVRTGDLPAPRARVAIPLGTYTRPEFFLDPPPV